MKFEASGAAYSLKPAAGTTDWAGRLGRPARPVEACEKPGSVYILKKPAAGDNIQDVAATTRKAARTTERYMTNRAEVYDVAIIGAGVCGANIARKLSQYELKVALLEKEIDVSLGTSKANSGIVHGGFHDNKKYLKARLELKGALMFERLHEELDFPFERCGIVVVALHEDELRTIEQLYLQGVENGVIGIEMCSRERMLELEPKLSPDTMGGLYAPSGGIVEPYRFVFSLVESARKNGVDLITEFAAALARRKDDEWILTALDGREIRARYVVNSAGLFADTLSKAFGAEDFTIKPRKGEYYLLDKMTRAKPNRVVFPVPTAVSKGMLIIPTVEGTVLIGPTASAVEDKEDFSTTRQELEKILQSARIMIPSISETDVITSFAGLRPTCGEDFIVELSAKVPHLVQVAAIQSPGLTASPAIGEYVKDLLKKDGLRLVEKPDWDPYVDKVRRARDLSPWELDEMVAKDPAYGDIVCRCERVSEAEIVQAIRAGHSTLDGIKYVTRAQMGRCQGGFCAYKIIKILMRETGMSYEEVTKRGGGSYVLRGEL
ncbi:MAG TPA: NAD(P)/FAD-dependent oxidoreductase [Spirochaetales bacterium]|nr:NAD(P)/FAD-dependent oxidoreductase [Spirochaetales bacterium]